MLTLTRRKGEGVLVGSDVEVVVVEVSRGRVRLGIRAPRSLPVHRSELVSRVGAHNRRAVAAEVVGDRRAVDGDSSTVWFPHGLFGMGDHQRFTVHDLGEGSRFHALVSCRDAAVQLIVAEAQDVWPGYPVEDVRRAAADVLPELAEQDTAVAVVVTAPADGSTPTVNLMAPLVVGLESRRAVQVIVERPELGLAHPLLPGRTREEARP